MRIERVIRLYELLGSQDYTTKELADILDVSRRTIYRDLSILRRVGFVDEAEEGRRRMYSLETKRRAPRLTFQEAVLLHAGADLLSKWIDPFVHAAAVRKLIDCVPQPMRKRVKAATKVVMAFGPSRRGARAETTWQLIEAAIDERPVRIRYAMRSGKRDVTTLLSPYALAPLDDALVVAGRSSLHRRMRVFYVKRISILARPDSGYVRPPQRWRFESRQALRLLLD